MASSGKVVLNMRVSHTVLIFHPTGRAIAEGDSLHHEYVCVVPIIRVASALDCLWRVLGAAGMSWREADHANIPEDAFTWTLPDDEAFIFHSSFYRMIAKLEGFLCAPDQVETSEVLDYLPQPDSCKWVRDRANHTFSSTEPLGVLISKAALLCGDSFTCLDQASSHTKAAAVRHLMPQKVMHAQAALGTVLLRRDRNGELREEALAVLDMALESTKKMRLQRYGELIQKSRKASTCS